VAKATSKPAKPSKPPSKPAKNAKGKAITSAPKAASGPKKPLAPSKHAPAKASSTKPTQAKKPAVAPAAKPAHGAKPAAAPKIAPVAESNGLLAAAAAAGKKVPPKGITVVNQRPMRKPKPKVKLQMPISEPLLKPGGKWKPLIPSGPKAPPTPTGGSLLGSTDGTKAGPKAKLPKRELDKYREILRRKRSELVGDVANMEEEALRQNSGSLSSLPQHMAEQGSDASEQSLSLDLAQVDRNLIREIDEALARIDAGTYGICELTHKPISPDRLAELPWARYSIEAARERERLTFRA